MSNALIKDVKSIAGKVGFNPLSRVIILKSLFIKKFSLTGSKKPVKFSNVAKMERKLYVFCAYIVISNKLIMKKVVINLIFSFIFEPNFEYVV